MATSSSIEWTEATWNPVTGCSKVSPGCQHCYAERMARRLQAMGQPNYAQGFKVSLQEQMLTVPLRWRRPKRIFVNSMSDLFHESVPIDFIRRVFEIMEKAHWHTYQVLTKRSQRLLELDLDLQWHPHVWMGVSVESERYTHRIDHLRKSRARVKFLSLEPLLGPLERLDLREIGWVIVGGESGPGARPMRAEWVLDIRDQCRQARVPFFFKQWGGVFKKQSGRQLEGETYDEMPASPDIRAGASL